MPSNKTVLQEPHSIEAEKAVLGAMMIDRDAISQVVELIKKEEYFWLDTHRSIFKAIIKLYERNIPTDLVTLTSELKMQNLIENIGGEMYLAELLDAVVTTANVVYYAKTVIDLYALRRIIYLCKDITRRSYKQSEEVEELLSGIEQFVFVLQTERVDKDFVHIKPVLGDAFEMIERLSEGHTTGINSGFADLDRLTTGFQNGDLIIVAGRPSMGKTSICLNIAEYISINKELPVGIFSLEMSKEQLVMRMLCSQARVSAQKIRAGFMKKGDWPRLTRAAGNLSDTFIFIDDTAGAQISSICAKARRLKSMHDIKFLIIDYIQLISCPKSESRQQEITTISRMLKGLARELNIPVVVVSQLSREVEKRKGHKPVLSDLRESGSIEQDADVVIFVFRQEFYDKTTENEGKADIVVAKQRNGPVGDFELAFLKDYTRFENLATSGYIGVSGVPDSQENE